MSQENVEVARAFFAAYNARDTEGVIGLLHPNATVTTLSQHGGLPSRRWQGDQIRRYFEELAQVWVEVRAEIEEYRVHGEYVVALGHICGTGRSSGLELDTPLGTTLLVKGSRIARVDSFSSWDEALEAAGLPEYAMSRQNVEVVLDGVHAINRRDVDAFAACLGSEVEWVESGDVFPGLRGVHRGQAAARRWFTEAILDPWESMKVEVEEITEAGESRVFAGFVATARGRASGLETELSFWTVFWFAEGKIARREVFWTRDQALEAAGLPE